MRIIFVILCIMFFDWTSYDANAHPTRKLNKKEFFEDNSIPEETNNHLPNVNGAAVSTYVCVYIPSDLELCNFNNNKDKSKDKLRNLAHTFSEKKKHKLISDNKIYSSHLSTRVTKIEKLARQTSVKTIVYEIQRCVPSRLPFVLPFCSEEDVSNKKNEFRRLLPFMVNDFDSHEFPTIPKQFRKLLAYGV